jgi:hypothetical protein
MVAGWTPSLVRAVTVQGSAPDQPLAVVAGDAQLAFGTGFVTWARTADASSSGPPIRAGSVDGSTPAGCYVDLAARIAPIGIQRIEPAAESTTLSWALQGAGADATDAGSRLGPESGVVMGATSDGASVPIEFDAESRTYQVIVRGPVASAPVVVVTATVDGYGQVASQSSALQEGTSLAPPRVAWSGPTRFEGDGTFGGRVTVTPAEVPAGSPIPDGVVCLDLGEARTSLEGVVAQAGEQRSCHPAGEIFEVNVEVLVEGERNGTFELTLPYTVNHRPVGTEADLVVSAGNVETPTFELARPADALKGALIGFVVIVMSTLLPLALLVFLVNEQRRLPKPSSRMVARVPLVPDGGAVRRVEGAGVTKLSMTPIAGDRRRYDLPGGVSLVSPRTLNPFAPTIVEARAEEGRVRAVPWMAPGAGRAVQVPAGFTYLVLIRSEPGSAQAEAIVVGPANGDAARADRAIDDAVRATNRLWGRVSSAIRLIDL